MALSDDEIRQRLIAGYLGAAARDIKAAELLANTHDADLASTAAYHVQQCAEKVAKAILVARDVIVTTEHRLKANLAARTAAVPSDPWPPKLNPLERYDAYATTSRYPTSTLGPGSP